MARARLHSMLGWVPVGLSLAAFLIVTTVLLTGWERGLKDEGAAAHLWQLFIVLQAPFSAAFLATADWRVPAAVFRRMGVIAAALLFAVAPVALFRL
jgi:hypothetical protein